jgi:hypothetical protein
LAEACPFGRILDVCAEGMLSKQFSLRFSEDRLKKLAATMLFAAAAVAPVASFGATVDSGLIPDGTYVVKVEKVQDSQHVLVVMQNGVETTLIARSNIDFNKVKTNDVIKVSLIKGIVPVYVVQ